MCASFVPCEGSAAKFLLGTSLVWSWGNGVNILEELWAWQVENLDAFFSSNYEPIKFLREENAVYWRFTVTLSEPFALNKIPNHNVAITGAWSEVAWSMHHVEGVDLSLVAGESVHESHVHIFPDFDGLVPWCSNTNTWLFHVVELDTRDGISVLVLVNDMLALASCVPDSNWAIKTSCDDLSVIGWKSNGENIFGVSNKSVDGFSGSNWP